MSNDLAKFTASTILAGLPPKDRIEVVAAAMLRTMHEGGANLLSTEVVFAGLPVGVVVAVGQQVGPVRKAVEQIAAGEERVTRMEGDGINALPHINPYKRKD